ncbi:MAG: S-methyl-5-thioribose-1-phosphate isomerase [Acidobacteriota bacterium]
MTTIDWKEGKVYMLDQRKLPFKEIMIEHSGYLEVADSIKNMVIRGAPAIGVAAAMGVAIGVNELADNEKNPEKHFNQIISVLGATRPTAVNLFWSLTEMKKIFDVFKNDTGLLKKEILKKALEIKENDHKINRAIGAVGETIINDGDTILTHCNAGALATAGYGTALGVMRSAFAEGKKFSVVAGETRPFLQGARLTVWELQKENIPVTLITDNMAGHLMSKGKIDLVIVGADRIALNGDAANKIGTYSIAVLAKHHNVPFYVAAPLSTVDVNSASGKDIPIEERDGDEVRTFREEQTTPSHTNVLNPAFDVTPFELITGIITEKKIIKTDPENNFKTILGK